MRTLSSGFLTATGRYYARLALPDGSEIGSEAIRSLTLTQTLNSSTEGLTLGGAGGAALTGVVTAPGTGLQDQKLRLYLGRMVSGALEEVPLGDYWVTSAVADGDAVTVSAVDAVTARMGGGYVPSSPAPATALAVLEDVCAQSGVELGDVTGLTDAPVTGSIAGYTLREMAGYMAALLGRCACMDGEGRLVLRWYTTSGISITPDDYYSGGLQLQSQDWTLGRLDCTVTTKASETDPDTGTTAAIEDSQTLTAGTGGGAVGLVNPWMTQAVLDGLLDRLGGLTYRGGTVALGGDLRLEPGDLIAAEALDGASYTVAVMQTALAYDGGLRLEVTSWAQSETDSQQPEGPLSQQVSRLKADVAEFKSLSAQNLTATNASLKNVAIDVANVTNLLAGNAGVGNLQAIHLTGDNVVIDDAVITDAMIAGLTAGKLTAGTIWTNLVTIASQSGNLSIVDNTIQIVDDAGTVRVQIGKDAAGDYNYYLWDAAGNLMWNPTGVTAAGLNAGIIKDVAIADDANISPGKIDMQAVAQRLNEDGSITVDAGRVTIDDTTLDVAYRSVTTKIDNSVTHVEIQYALSPSQTVPPSDGWAVITPEPQEGQYLWQKTVTTYGDGSIEESLPTCLSGMAGKDGEDATVLRIDSSRGTVFKNSAVSTVLSVVIYHGSQRITDKVGLTAVFGSGAYLEWSWQRMEESTFGVISSDDSRITNDGFCFTLSPDDVDTKVVFQCSLNI